MSLDHCSATIRQLQRMLANLGYYTRNEPAEAKSEVGHAIQWPHENNFSEIKNEAEQVSVRVQGSGLSKYFRFGK